MAIDQTDEPVSVPQALGRLRVALEDAYTRASRELVLTPQQAELLCAARSSSAVGDLAAALRCDRSNVTRLVDRIGSSVGPQIRTADTGGWQADDRVSFLQDLRFGALLDPNIARAVHRCTTHNGLLDLAVVELG